MVVDLAFVYMHVNKIDSYKASSYRNFIEPTYITISLEVGVAALTGLHKADGSSICTCSVAGLLQSVKSLSSPSLQVGDQLAQEGRGWRKKEGKQLLQALDAQ